MLVSIKTLRGIEVPGPGPAELRWVVPAAQRTLVLIYLDLLEGATDADPRVPISISCRRPARTTQTGAGTIGRRSRCSNAYPVTQAYPEIATHTDAGQPVRRRYCYASWYRHCRSPRRASCLTLRARNYRGGLDPERDGPAANVVRILHDDGTYGIYAHLNTNYDSSAARRSSFDADNTSPTPAILVSQVAHTCISRLHATPECGLNLCL